MAAGKKRGSRRGLRKVSGIYAVVNFSKRKFYVGSSVDVKARFVAHKGELNKGRHHCKSLQADWVKCGEEAFHFILLEGEVHLDDLHVREIFWIKTLSGSDGSYNKGTPSIRTKGKYESVDRFTVKGVTIHVGMKIIVERRKGRDIFTKVERISKWTHRDKPLFIMGYGNVLGPREMNKLIRSSLGIIPPH